MTSNRLRRPRTCNRCRAARLWGEAWTWRCGLGYATEVLCERNKYGRGCHAYEMVPLEPCPKPITYITYSEWLNAEQKLEEGE